MLASRNISLLKINASRNKAPSLTEFSIFSKANNVEEIKTNLIYKFFKAL